MRNRKIILGLIIVGALLTGCSSDKEEQKKESSTYKNESTAEKQENVKEFKELPLILGMEERGDYLINVPSGGARPWSVAYSAPIKKQCFMLYDYFIGLYLDEYGYTLEDFKTAEDVVPKMSKQIITMVLYNTNQVGVGKLVITEKENKTVNGRDWIRSEAYIEAGAGKGYKDDKVHLIIYSMLRDGKPLYIAGVDRTKEQDQIDIVANYTDMSIQTFRDIE